MTAAVVLLPTVAGDALHLPGEARERCGPRCAAADRAFACLTHGVRLANQCQLELHTEHGGTHVIARLCPVHGAEEWTP